jgi:2,3-bisphosphoglycerate-independent phosphoglycerate mutase
MLQSPKDVSTYDQKPQMAAYEVCEAVVSRLRDADCPPLIVVNFANGDMVGHTGKLEAAVRAIEVVDECCGRIVDATLARGGSLIITADHGNAEQMWNPQTSSPHTAHTTYDVPLIVVGEAFRGSGLRHADDIAAGGARLADIAPTVLAMLGLPQPSQMDGRSLLK